MAADLHHVALCCVGDTWTGFCFWVVGDRDVHPQDPSTSGDGASQILIQMNTVEAKEARLAVGTLLQPGDDGFRIRGGAGLLHVLSQRAHRGVIKTGTQRNLYTEFPFQLIAERNNQDRGSTEIEEVGIAGDLIEVEDTPPHAGNLDLPVVSRKVVGGSSRGSALGRG